MMAEHGLGEVVSRHAVDNGRRGIVAVVGGIVGVVATVVAVPLLVSAFDYEAGDSSNRGVFPGLVAGVGLIGLWLAVANGIGYLTRRDEEFVVHEGGLVRRRAGREVAVAWGDIRGIRDDSRDYGRSFGWDVYVRIRVKGGPRLLITGFVENAERLVAAVKRKTA